MSGVDPSLLYEALDSESRFRYNQLLKLREEETKQRLREYGRRKREIDAQCGKLCSFIGFCFIAVFLFTCILSGAIFTYSLQDINYMIVVFLVSCAIGAFGAFFVSLLSFAHYP